MGWGFSLRNTATHCVTVNIYLNVCIPGYIKLASVPNGEFVVCRVVRKEDRGSLSPCLLKSNTVIDYIPSLRLFSTVDVKLSSKIVFILRNRRGFRCENWWNEMGFELLHKYFMNDCFGVFWHCSLIIHIARSTCLMISFNSLELGNWLWAKVCLQAYLYTSVSDLTD